jgi:IclR family transcriptional regulator, KDG regulon repressor
LTSKDNRKTSKSYSVPAVQRMLDLIEAMTSTNHELTITQANRKFKIPKSSVYAILQTLKSRGYVDKDKDDRYFLTLKLFSLGSALVDSLDLRSRVYPLLKELTEKAQITGHISVLDNGYAVYIEKVEVMGAVRLTTWVGKRMHVHSTAMGKALVAHFSDHEIKQFVEEHGLKRQTEKTLSNLRDFKKDLARVRTVGYSVSSEENELGVRAVAAPIFDHRGVPIAAVNLGGSTLQIKVENFHRLGELVRSYALKMSRTLGYQGPGRG